MAYQVIAKWQIVPNLSSYKSKDQSCSDVAGGTAPSWPLPGKGGRARGLPSTEMTGIPLTVKGPDCSPGLSEKSQPLSWLKSRARNSQQTDQCLAHRCSFNFCLETDPSHSISEAHFHPGTIWKRACPIPPCLLATCCIAWCVSSPQFMPVWATNTCLFYMNRWKQELKYMESRKEGRSVKLGHIKNGNSEDRLAFLPTLYF